MSWRELKDGEAINPGDMACYGESNNPEAVVASGWDAWENFKDWGVISYGQLKRRVQSQFNIHLTVVREVKDSPRPRIIKGQDMTEEDAMRLFFTTPAGQWGGYGYDD